MKRKPKRADQPLLIRVVSDLHAGSTVALCPPKIQLDDGGEYHASKPQLWLWERWQHFWREGEQLRRRLDAHCIDLFNGDMTEGDHHKTTQILSGNPTAQAAVVDAVMKVPLATKPDNIVMIRGTEAHVGPSAAFEERIAKGLRKDGQRESLALDDDPPRGASRLCPPRQVREPPQHQVQHGAGVGL